MIKNPFKVVFENETCKCYFESLGALLETKENPEIVFLHALEKAKEQSQATPTKLELIVQMAFPTKGIIDTKFKKPVRGRVYKRRRRDPKDPTKIIEAPNWWIQYYHGRPIRKPTKTSNYDQALAQLNKEIAMTVLKKPGSQLVENYKFEEMAKSITRDYVRNQRSSISRVKVAVKHLSSFFGRDKVAYISTSRIEQYIDYRLEIEHASNATVKYEISALKRMFHLSQDIIEKIPRFPRLRVQNTRKGFFEDAEFNIFLQHFDIDLQPVLVFAYLTGWRMKSEIFPLQWPQVDFDAGEIRLEPGTTKTGEGRTLPFSAVPELEEIIKTQKEKADKSRQLGTDVSLVFPCTEKRIRLAWEKALEASKIGHKIPHDFRRTAVRNFERAGLSRSVAMQIVGHKTESIYRRYAIVSKNDIIEGLKRLTDYRARLKELQNRNSESIS